MSDVDLANGSETTQTATLFLDSNVINELMTPLDLDRAIAAHMALPKEATREAQVAAVVEVLLRQANARGSLWLLMVLDHEHRATLSLAEEVIPWAERNASPVPEKRNWASAWIDVMAHFVCADIYSGWTRLGTPTRRGGHKANDSLIVEICRLRGFGVITRDQGLMRKAERAGVLAQTPEAYALASGLSLDAGRSRFFERYDASMGKWIEQMVADRVPQDAASTTAAAIRENFQFMWADDVTTGINYRTFFKDWGGA